MPMRTADPVFEFSDAGYLLAMLSLAAGQGRMALPWVLDQSAQAVNHTGTVAETTKYTKTVPAGAVPTDGALRVSVRWSCNNNANTKNLRLKLGATTLITSSGTANGNAFIFTIGNRGGSITSSNSGSSGTGLGSVTSSTAAIDLSTDQSLTLTAETPTSAADNLQIEYLLVEVLPK